MTVNWIFLGCGQNKTFEDVIDIFFFTIFWHVNKNENENRMINTKYSQQMNSIELLQIELLGVIYTTEVMVKH